MAGRALAFSDPRIIALATDEFVPVAADDWRQRRRDDAEGEFFRSVADQGPRKGVGGDTRQGIYCLTASGKLLVYKNSVDPEVMHAALREGLAAWKKLPANERAKGAVNVPPLDPDDVDRRFVPTPPERGLILKVHARSLDRDENGDFHSRTDDKSGYAGLSASTDHLWLTEREWRSLAPAGAKAGDTLDVPAPVAYRIARFHLVDNTRGEPPFWSRNEVRSLKLTAKIVQADAAGMRLRLEGDVGLATNEDLAAADRGFTASLLGYIDFDAQAQRISRFDLVAIGEHWGEGKFTPGARPGRTPFGVTFDLVSSERAADLVPPQGIREKQAYLSADR